MYVSKIKMGIGDSKCFAVFGRKLRDCKYCAKGAVGSKPEVCMRVCFLRVHQPPLLKASTNWQTWSPHLHPQDYVPSKSWGKHSSVRHCWFFERGCCKFGEHCPFSHKTWQKDPEKKASKSHCWRVFFFGSVRFAWTVAGDGERGLSNRAQHQKWLPEMLDCWFLMHVGWSTCSFWNMALISSIHLPWYYYHGYYFWTWGA